MASTLIHNRSINLRGRLGEQSWGSGLKDSSKEELLKPHELRNLQIAPYRLQSSLMQAKNGSSIASGQKLSPQQKSGENDFFAMHVLEKLGRRVCSQPKTRSRDPTALLLCEDQPNRYE
jgi:hypothetical protein